MRVTVRIPSMLVALIVYVYHRISCEYSENDWHCEHAFVRVCSRSYHPGAFLQLQLS